jgi:hypothetical protein
MIVDHLESIGGIPEDRNTEERYNENWRCVRNILRKHIHMDNLYNERRRVYELHDRMAGYSSLSESEKQEVIARLEQVNRGPYYTWTYTLEHGETMCCEKFTYNRGLINEMYQRYYNDGWRCAPWSQYKKTIMIADYEEFNPNIRTAITDLPAEIPRTWKLQEDHKALELLINIFIYKYSIQKPEKPQKISEYFASFLSSADKNIRENKIVLDCAGEIQHTIGYISGEGMIYSSKLPFAWISPDQPKWYHYPATDTSQEEFKLISREGSELYIIEQLTYVDGKLTQEVKGKHDRVYPH